MYHYHHSPPPHYHPYLKMSNWWAPAVFRLKWIWLSLTCRSCHLISVRLLNEKWKKWRRKKIGKWDMTPGHLPALPADLSVSLDKIEEKIKNYSLTCRLRHLIFVCWTKICSPSLSSFLQLCLQWFSRKVGKTYQTLRIK